MATRTAEIVTQSARPKPGSKAFVEYKASLCERALTIKKKMDKLAGMYAEVITALETVFIEDDKEFFSNLGFVKKDSSKSYNIPEEHIDQVRELLAKNNLIVDDYINQKTSWGLTAKLRSKIKNEDDPLHGILKPLIEVKETSRISVKAS
jgi:hypothetical protein